MKGKTGTSCNTSFPSVWPPKKPLERHRESIRGKVDLSTESARKKAIELLGEERVQKLIEAALPND